MPNILSRLKNIHILVLLVLTILLVIAYHTASEDTIDSATFGGKVSVDCSCSVSNPNPQNRTIDYKVDNISLSAYVSSSCGNIDYVNISLVDMYRGYLVAYNNCTSISSSSGTFYLNLTHSIANKTGFYWYVNTSCNGNKTSVYFWFFTMSNSTEVYVDDDAPPDWYDAVNHFDFIDEAIDYVRPHGTVYIYDGTYTDADIAFSKPVNIVGNGTDSTYIDQTDTDLPIFEVFYYSGSNIHYYNYDPMYVNISGIYFYGNHYDDSLSVLISGSYRVNISNCAFYDVDRGIKVVLSNNITIYNCTLYKTKHESIYGLNSSDIIVSNCYIDHHELYYSCKGMYFKNCTEVNITDNYFYKLQQYGVYLYDSNDVIVYNNYGDDGWYFAYMIDSQDIKLHWNVINISSSPVNGNVEIIYIKDSINIELANDSIIVDAESSYMNFIPITIIDSSFIYINSSYFYAGEDVYIDDGIIYKSWDVSNVYINWLEIDAFKEGIIKIGLNFFAGENITANHLYIQDCNIGVFMYPDIESPLVPENINISNSYFNNCNIGIDFSAVNISIYNVNINGTCEGIDLSADCFDYPSNILELSYCTITNCTEGILGGVANASIHHNSIIGTGNSEGRIVSLEGIYLQPIENVSITYNNISGFCNFSLCIDSPYGAEVHHNIFYNSGQNVNTTFSGGLCLYTGNTVVYNNIFSNNSYNIQILDTPLASENITIYNNYITNGRIANAYEAPGVTDVRWNTTKHLGINIVSGDYIFGNYWDDYDGIDADGDGIGDTPYNKIVNCTIPDVSEDYYPGAKCYSCIWYG